MFIGVSCSNNDEEMSTGNPAEISPTPSKISWNFPTLTPGGTGAMADPNIYFEYDSKGRVIKKKGGFKYASPGTGYNSVSFSKDIYTDVYYDGNIISTSTFSSDPNYTAPINKRIFEVDQQGKIIKSIIESVNNIYSEKHLTYHYNSSGKLIEIVTEFPNMPYDPNDPEDYIWTLAKRFTYDNAGNLKESVEVERRNGVDFLVGSKKKFSNFDSALNPLKRLGIFEEYFYFSLSENNFQKVETTFTNGNVESTWVNQYDSNGKLKLYY